MQSMKKVILKKASNCKKISKKNDLKKEKIKTSNLKTHERIATLD